MSYCNRIISILAAQYSRQVYDLLTSRILQTFPCVPVGNRRFRDLIAASTDKYDSAKSRLEKSMVVHFIVEEVKKIKGRFLKQDRFSGKWYELDERQAKEKVGHAIRDATSSIDPKKKGLKKSRSSSSSTSAAPKKNPFQNQQQNSPIGREMSFYVSPENPSSNMMVYTTTESMDESAQSLDRIDDLEPLNVDSPEAQNSMTELQRDSSFLHRLSVSLVEPNGSLRRDGRFELYNSSTLSL